MVTLAIAVVNLVLLVALFLYVTFQNENLRQQIRALQQKETQAEPSAPIVKPTPPISLKIPSKPAETTFTPSRSKQPSRLANYVRRLFQHLFFTTFGLAKIGAAILLLGLLFLAKLMDDYGYFPLPTRMICLAILACALFAVGVHLAKTRRNYGALLMGVGFATAYLVVFFSCSIFHLIPTLLAISLLILISLVLMAASLYFKHKLLVLIGLLGAFLTTITIVPHPLPTGFILVYYCILNLLIFILVSLCHWLRLAWFGLIASGLVGYYWYSALSPVLWHAEVFVLLTFAIYFALVLLQLKFSENSRLKITSLFALNSALSFSLQYMLLINNRYWLGIIFLFMSLVHGALILFSKKIIEFSHHLFKQTNIVLSSAFFALAFTSLLDMRIAGFVWALQSTLLIWLGVKSRNLVILDLGALQQFILLVSLLIIFYPIRSDDMALWLASGVVTFAAALCGSYYLDQQSHTSQKALWKVAATTNFVLANIYLLYVCINWIYYAIPAGYIGFTLLISSAVYILFYIGLHRKLQWYFLEYLLFALPVLYLLINFAVVLINHQHFILLGFIISFASALAFYFLNPMSKDREVFFSILIWTIFLTILMQCFDVIRTNYNLSTNYVFITFLVAGIVTVWLGVIMQYYAEKCKNPAPLLTCTLLYPVSLLLSILLILVNPWISPNVSPLRYFPVINPLDGSVLVAMITLISMRRHILSENKKFYLCALWLILFVVLNSILVRGMFSTQGLEYTFSTFIASTSIQFTLTILWSIIGFLLIVFAIVKKSKLLKISGMTLILVTLAKLIFVDLAQLSPLLRIVAFIGVGALLLLLGYIAKTDR